MKHACGLVYTARRYCSKINKNMLCAFILIYNSHGDLAGIGKQNSSNSFSQYPHTDIQ